MIPEPRPEPSRTGRHAVPSPREQTVPPPQRPGGRHRGDGRLTIVVPMAGRGSRFADAGYSVPKPLIEVVDGYPMIELVVANLSPAVPHRFVFIAQREHDAAFGLRHRLRDMVPGSELVLLDGVTEGAACTVLAARDHIDRDAPLMIANSDQWVDIEIDDYLASHRGSGHSGFIMTMSAEDPKWSYVDFDQQGRVSGVVEKVVVSDVATVGVYNFAYGGDFLAAADAMIAADKRVGGEFYVAPCYNELIAAGGTVGVHGVGREAAGMHGLGIPADLELFRGQEACARALRQVSRLRGRPAQLHV